MLSQLAAMAEPAAKDEMRSANRRRFMDCPRKNALSFATAHHGSYIACQPARFQDSYLFRQFAVVVVRDSSDYLTVWQSGN
jgi:hypothetical protein